MSSHSKTASSIRDEQFEINSKLISTLVTNCYQEIRIIFTCSVSISWSILFITIYRYSTSTMYTVPKLFPGYDDKNGKQLNNLSRKASPRTSLPCRCAPTAPRRSSQPTARANSAAPVSGREQQTNIIAIPCRVRSWQGNKAQI